MGNSEFVKLVKHLRKKHGFRQKHVARLLDTSETTISNIIHKRQRYTGNRFLSSLRWVVDELEGRHVKPVQSEPLTKQELKQDELWICPRCGEKQAPLDTSRPYCRNRACNKYRPT